MLTVMLRPGVFRHVTCRNNTYSRSDVVRFPVPDEMVHWPTPYARYSPPDYTASHIHGQLWADTSIGSASSATDFKWNELDGTVNRESHHGPYELELDEGRPLNPIGRTGLRGRGLLGRWGPNHAADPVVTRWKRDSFGHVLQHDFTKKPILQMIAIQRRDNGMWAIPGGMVDPGEEISATLKREFMEETMSNTDRQALITDFFETAKRAVIYKGYVDDYRNTDNAWIETVACNFHDDLGDRIATLPLSAGDDAVGAQWMDIDRGLKLHANHTTMVEPVATNLNAHW